MNGADSAVAGSVRATGGPREPVVKRSLVVMSAIVSTIGVVTALYWLQSLFIPLALAILISLVLVPVTLWLERQGLGRTSSVVAVATLMALAVLILLGVATYQCNLLVAELPKNTENIRRKVGGVRTLFSGRSYQQFDAMWNRITEEAKGEAPKPGTETTKTVHEGAVEVDDGRTRVIVAPGGENWLTSTFEWAEPVLEKLATIAFASVLVLFMLLSREDLRNRLLRLMGDGHLTVTTRAIDEAIQRITRFLLMQAIMNTAYGAVLTVVMLVFGLPYAILGGFMAAVLRYIPFVGGFVAALFPIALSLAVYSNWWPAILLVVVLLAIEIVVSNILEPWLYGKSMGVSIVAYLVGAAFWTFLWGGIGLVMSGPLTVCLAVIGKYVPQLHFLNILLGDEPVLDPQIGFYQRLMARDVDEAIALALAEHKASSLETVYDRLIQPALCQMRRDLEHDRLPPEDVNLLIASMGEVTDRLADAEPAEPSAAGTGPEPAAPRPGLRLLCVPARDALDVAPLRIAARAVEQEGWTLEFLDRQVITADLLTAVEDHAPNAVCLGLVRPGGDAHLRYLLKRIGERFPDLRVFVCRLHGSAGDDGRWLTQDHDGVLVSESVPHLIRDLRAWHPVLAQGEKPEQRLQPMAG